MTMRNWRPSVPRFVVATGDPKRRVTPVTPHHHTGLPPPCSGSVGVEPIPRSQPSTEALHRRRQFQPLAWVGPRPLVACLSGGMEAARRPPPAHLLTHSAPPRPPPATARAYACRHRGPTTGADPTVPATSSPSCGGPARVGNRHQISLRRLHGSRRTSRSRSTQDASGDSCPASSHATRIDGTQTTTSPKLSRRRSSPAPR
jgi:hypothetical protein